MNTTKQAIWLFLTLLVLAGSGWYYAHFNQAIINKKALLNEVDTTISQLTVKQFNSEGVLINLLTTPQVEYIPNNNLHLLKNPHIIIKQDNQPAWEINSLRAKSFDGGKQITFIEQVVVHQNPGESTRESTLKTEEITYYPKEKKATTSLFVTFEQPGNIIQSTGMNAYLDEKRVELLHKARGSYDPAKG
ncbi:lipopolysaccharide exporter periplasmic protein [Legionella pneumophila]|uniref:LPS export ABC transporter periplasmic protein LptC n=1 Tax=Legionella pneumophila TaxID=446 RepID=UPI000770A669|nr:LPS export ABC transporter periplasmic protein LptC [Legionella pneumophila]CZG52162.1 lipopolysaccharide exporter periplasmic protein [Legionella pneumophila]CZG52238.1 lipopolysaccharide exporter periplasmic protein [Legionella pneumophila]